LEDGERSIEVIGENAAVPFCSNIEALETSVWFDRDGSTHPGTWSEWYARSAQRKRNDGSAK
jgi:hypothetical protein